MLGSWREKSAYPLLAAFLRQNPLDVEEVLGDAITATSHRVMAAVYNGDPKPLYELILDPEADEFIRSRMCEALAMVALRNELPKTEAADFLERCFYELRPAAKNQVWVGWKNAIAMLGLLELKPLVQAAFEQGLIDEELGTFRQFEEEDMALTDPRPGQRLPWMDGDYNLFGDIVEELSSWQRLSRP